MDETGIKDTPTPIAKEPAMPTSEARKIANRMNSAKSTGPKTPEGKERSRRNGLKHGMTGQGVVIPEGDAAEVEVRDAALRAELAPKSVLGAILVGQMATLSIRMERGAAREFASVAERVRHAEVDFDEARVARAEEVMESIGDDPRRAIRKLLKSPEGVDLMLRSWEELRAGLAREGKPLWTLPQLVTAANLIGVRAADARESRLGVLSMAAWGNFEVLKGHEGAGLDAEARKAWARARLVEAIDEEVAGLEDHLETLDFEMIEQDRAEAGARALFDPSKEASLARRYESEARRGFFRSLKEFRQAEAEAAERAASEPASAIPSPVESCVPLASSCDGPPGGLAQPEPAPRQGSPTPSRPGSDPAPRGAEVVRGADGRPFSVGQPISGAA